MNKIEAAKGGACADCGGTGRALDLGYYEPEACPACNGAAPPAQPGDAVERVARELYALKAKEAGYTWQWDTRANEVKDEFRRMARAAIAALEQPK